MNITNLNNLYISKENFTNCFDLSEKVKENFNERVCADGKNSFLEGLKPYEGAIRAFSSLLSFYAPIQKPMLSIYAATVCISQYKRVLDQKCAFKETFCLVFILSSIVVPNFSRPLFFMNEARKELEKLYLEKKERTHYRNWVSLAYHLTALAACLSVPGLLQFEFLVANYLFLSSLALLDLMESYEKEGKPIIEILLYSLILLARLHQFHLGIRELHHKMNSSTQSGLQALPPWAQERREMDAIKNQLGKDCLITKIENSDSYQVIQNGISQIVEVKYLPRTDGLCGPIDFELIFS